MGPCTSRYKKLTSTMPANYSRWVFEQKKVEYVETPREWIIHEAKFQTVAAETLWTDRKTKR